MRSTTEACLDHVYWRVFAVVFGTLVLGCEYGLQETHQGGDSQTNTAAENMNRTQPALIDGRSEHNVGQEDDVNVVESFTIAKGGDLVVLPVVLDGKEYLFMLDSGTTFHIFDLSLRQYLGMPIRTGAGKTGGADIAVQAFDPPVARVGELEFSKDDLVVCADLKMLRYATGKDVYGILGVPFFTRHVVQIDWHHGTVSVFKAGTPPDAEWGEAFPITFDELGGPVLEASLAEGVSTGFLIDVGANTSGTLASDLFNHLVDRNLLRVTGDRAIASAGGNIRRPIGLLDELRIGEFTHRNLIFDQGRSDKLGLGYLSRYRVTFDFANATVYLKKAKGYSRIDHEDMSGLRLMRVEGETIVYSVDQGSPAYLAGMRDRDTIVRIGGKPASAYELADIRRLLRSGDGKEIVLTSKRGSHEMTSTIRLREKRPK